MKLVAYTLNLPEGTDLGEAMMIIPGDLTEFPELGRAPFDLAGEIEASGTDRARAAMAAIMEMFGRGKLVRNRARQNGGFDA
jgi:hypothetical protein